MIDPIDELSDKAFLSCFIVLYGYSLNLIPNHHSQHCVKQASVFHKPVRIFEAKFEPKAAKRESHGKTI